MKKLTIAFILMVPVAAQAQSLFQRDPAIALGLDAGAAAQASEGSTSSTGIAMLARAGYEFPNGVTPELAVTWAHWGDASESEYSVLPGLRWSILGGMFRPWISFHVGYGKLTATVLSQDFSADGIGLNTGAGLDVMITPKIGVGAHASWNKVIIDQNSSGMQTGEAWGDFGLGLALAL